MIRIAACWAGALLLCLSTGAASAAPAITKLEARHEHPRWVIGRVLHQTADLISTLKESERAEALNALQDLVTSHLDAGPLPPQAADEQGIRSTLDAVEKLVTIWPDPGISPRPVMPLYEIELQTRSHAARLPGLCVADMVVLKFEPVGKDIGSATRVKVSEVFVEHWYHALVPPPAPELPAASPDQRRSDDAPCAKLDHDKDDFFSASDDAQAIRAAWTANTLNVGLRADPIPFAFTCKDSPATDCLKWLKEQTPGPVQPGWVYDCKPGICQVLLAGMVYTATMEQTAPFRIRNVGAEAWVVIADMRRD